MKDNENRRYGSNCFDLDDMPIWVMLVVTIILVILLPVLLPIEGINWLRNKIRGER